MVVAACAAAAFAQAGHWRDTETLFRHAARVTRGGNWVAEANLGYEYHRRGDDARSLAHVRAALGAITPWLTPDMEEGYLRIFREDCPHHYSF